MTCSVAAMVMLAASSANLMAATVSKNDTTTMQANATDGSAAPAAADIGSFNGTLSAANAAALTLSQNGYDAWASGHGLTGSNALLQSDPDFDGIDNQLEFVLSGEPKRATQGGEIADRADQRAERPKATATARMG